MMKIAPRAIHFWMAITLLLAGLARQSAAQLVEVGDGGPGPARADHLTAELVALRSEVAAGGTQQVGLVLTPEQGWHVYWINAGDSGLPPRIRWTLPEGITAAAMRFPPPTRLPLGGQMDFGYKEQVAFPVEIAAEKTLKPGKAHLDAHVNWLVCAAQCFPGKAHLGLDLNVVAGPLNDAPLAGVLGNAIRSVPAVMPSSMQASIVADSKSIAITLHTGKRETDAQFYPFDTDQIADAAPQSVEPLADGVRVVLQRPAGSTSLPQTLHGLVELNKENYEFTGPVTAGTVAPATSSSAGDATPAAADAGVGLLSELALAFLGGMLLNLMPCVFPVLFLKGLALVHSSGEEKRHQRMHGFIYTAGVLVSFWVVVGILLLIRAGGRQVGWGFQMQSPAFVAILAALVFFLGLSLAGQFEIGLTLTSAGDGLTRKQGFAGSFFTGVLATVVATPCMAPLLGAAIGFALSQPAAITFLVFTLLALGLALPYLVLTLQPKWTSILPRPGAWMEILKQLTAVPLFATAIWLAWVYGQLFGADEGINRMALMLLSFLVLAIAGWALGRWPARWGSTLAAAVLVTLALVFPLRKSAAQTEVWEPLSPETFAAARSSGDPIFVDFTAAWCLSCKVNEATVLRSQTIEEKLAKHHFKLLKADWTQYDPKITADLAGIHRSGVPTYVIYAPGNDSPAQVLPELLTRDIVSKAIDANGASNTASK